MISEDKYAELQAELLRTKEELRIQKAMTKKYKDLFLIYADGPTSIAIVKDGKIISINKSFLGMFGYKRQEVLEKELISVIHPEEREKVLELNTKRQGGISVLHTYDVRGLKKNGQTIHLLISAKRILLQGEYATIVYLQDASELANKAAKDRLTQLYNSGGFSSFAEPMLKGIRRRGRDAWVFFIDLNKLKEINDTLGHPSGNQALVETGNVLRETFRQSDIIGRIGGDEFAVVAEATPGIHPMKIIHRLERNVNAINSKGNKFTLSLSVGILIHPAPKEEMPYRKPSNEPPLETLLKIADEAMYKAKRRVTDSSTVRYSIVSEDREVSAEEKAELLRLIE